MLEPCLAFPRVCAAASDRAVHLQREPTFGFRSVPIGHVSTTRFHDRVLAREPFQLTVAQEGVFVQRSSIVTLTTDFGMGSPYVAQMKGVLLSICSQIQCIDVTHAIRPQDVRGGAYVLQEVGWRFPAGTVHIAVVDPQVGTDRPIVLAEIRDQVWIAPDNGLLSLLTTGESVRCWVLNQPRYWLPQVSKTFHGRDIMAPVAAHWMRGVTAEQLGEPGRLRGTLDWPVVKQGSGYLQGEILWIDSFGNAITNIRSTDLEASRTAHSWTLVCREQQVTALIPTYAVARTGDLVALVGSSEWLELAVVCGDAARSYGFSAGDPVTIRWS